MPNLHWRCHRHWAEGTTTKGTEYTNGGDHTDMGSGALTDLNSCCCFDPAVVANPLPALICRPDRETTCLEFGQVLSLHF